MIAWRPEEPELLGSPPRRVVPRPGRAGKMPVGCMRIFLIPFMIVGVITFASAVQTTLVQLFGSRTEAVIQDRVYLDSDEGQGRWAYDYTFVLRGTVYQARDDEYGRNYHPGNHIPLRYAAWLPSHGSVIDDGMVSPLRVLAFPWLFTLFWNAITGVFVIIVYVGPLFMKRVYTHGQVVHGTITSKRTTENDGSTIYYLEYSYRPFHGDLSIGEPVLDKTVVAKQDWERLQVGDSVSVLALSRRFAKSVIYATGDYLIVPTK